MYLKLSLLCSVLLVFFACSKDEHAAPSEGSRLRRVMAGGQVQTEYFYNTKGLISKQVSKNISETNYLYDFKDRLIKKEDLQNYSNALTSPKWSKSYTDYSYEANNRLALEKTYLEIDHQYKLVSKQVHTYNNSGLLINTAIAKADDTPGGKTTYKYNNNGNIISKEEYSYRDGVYKLALKYTYDVFDDKQNPYRKILHTVLPYFVNNNNIKHTTIYNYNIYPGSVETTEDVSEYKTYNSNGFPIEVLENGSVFIYQYE